MLVGTFSCDNRESDNVVRIETDIGIDEHKMCAIRTQELVNQIVTSASD